MQQTVTIGDFGMRSIVVNGTIINIYSNNNNLVIFNSNIIRVIRFTSAQPEFIPKGSKVDLTIIYI